MEELVVFRYSTKPSFGMRGTYGGYELIIFGNGTVNYIIYTFSNVISGVKYYDVDDECIKSVINIINRNNGDLSKIPQKLNNGTLDGSMQEIELYGNLTIHCNTLRKTVSNGRSKILNPHSQLENMLVSILEEIKTCIKHYGISMEVFEVKFDGKCQFNPNSGDITGSL